MVDELYIMIAAVMLSIGLMMFLAARNSDFVNAHPAVKMLALCFLVLIGSTLVADGFEVHVDEPLIYDPTAFAIAVEALNLSCSRRQSSRAGRAAEPVTLPARYARSSITVRSDCGAPLGRAELLLTRPWTALPRLLHVAVSARRPWRARRGRSPGRSSPATR